MGFMAENKKIGRKDQGRIFVFLLMAIGLLLLLAPRGENKFLIYNPTPSVPEGFYVRAGGGPGKGRLILFRVPEVVSDYSENNYDKEPLKYFIKPVVGAGGDQICYQDEIYKINGEEFAAATMKDSDGHNLPVWTECRELSADEFFVFSDRVSNSFDSRHYGPVKQSEVLGVFRPLWTKAD